MKLRLYVMLALLAFVALNPVTAQTVDDVLEKGIKLDDKSFILLRVDADGNFLYEVWPVQKNKYRPLSDAPLFLSTLDYAHIYMRPVNPLNFSHQTDIVFTVDPIEKAASEAIGSIVKSVQEHLKNSEFIGENIHDTGLNLNKNSLPAQVLDTCIDFKQMVTSMTAIHDKLKNDKKSDIVNIFEKLKKMSFNSESKTKDELKEAADAIQELADYYDNTAGALDNFNKSIEELACGSEREVFINKFIFKMLAEEMARLFSIQTTRLNNVRNVYNAVKTAQEEASRENEDDLKWVVPLKPVEIKNGEVSEFTLTINETGYTLSPDKEIVKLELKEKSKRTIKFRKFQRFVPEVLAGTAYTSLEFPKFSTTKNAAGEEVVTDAGAESVRRLNITTMVNFNYYLRHSNVHPFIQLGVGANVGYPTLLLGTGLRFKLKGVPAFTLAVGGASTWVKELKTLHIGDKVTGMADVEKDITHAFKAPAIYYGIQIHL